MRKKIFGISLLLLFVTCTTHVSERSDNVQHVKLKEVNKLNDSTIVLYMDLIDSGLKQNVRMIEFKAKVADLIQCQTQLNIITNRYGGYVSREKNRNRKLGIDTNRIREDSNMITTHFQPTSTIILRIPHFYIDSALKEIQENLDYIDYSYAKVNDSLVSRYTAHNYLQGLQKHTKERYYWSSTQSSMMSYEKIIDEYTNNFGAVILTIYQNPQSNFDMTAIPATIPSYKPSFSMQCKIELHHGIEIIVNFWFFVLRFWPFVALLVLLGAVGWINCITNESTTHFRNWFDSPKS